MFRSEKLRGLALGACVALAVLGAACDGDDDGDDEQDEEAELDLIALVSAAFEETPRRLPDGLTLSRVYYAGKYSNDSGPSVDFDFTAADGTEGHAVAVVFRTVAEARAMLDGEVEYFEVPESSSRGRYCYWDEFSTYVNFDFEGISFCMGRSGNVYLEVEFGEVPEDEPEAALELLQEMGRHFDSLAEDATARVRRLKPEPLASSLAAFAPPGPGDREFATDPQAAFTDPEDTSGLIERVQWLGDSSRDASVFFYTFETVAQATAYRETNLVSVTGPGATACAIPSETNFRFCGHQSEEVVILVQRQAEVSAPAVDSYLQAWAEELVKHVADVRSGKLPRAPRATATPSGTRTPTVPPPPPATSTPTATPLPQVDRFNAGTWTLPIIVSSNTCPGGQPAVGTEVTLQYEFTDSDGDGYIYPGELFSIEQILPGYSDLGATFAVLPTTRFAAATTAGTLTGGAILELTFIAENETLVSYVESYGTCSIRGE